MNRHDKLANVPCLASSRSRAKIHAPKKGEHETVFESSNGHKTASLRSPIIMLALCSGFGLGFTTLCPGTHACQSKPLARAHAGPRQAAARSDRAEVNNMPSRGS